MFTTQTSTITAYTTATPSIYVSASAGFTPLASLRAVVSAGGAGKKKMVGLLRDEQVDAGRNGAKQADATSRSMPVATSIGESATVTSYPRAVTCVQYTTTAARVTATVTASRRETFTLPAVTITASVSASVSTRATVT
ncbi:MAG: hypothetical protein MMC23_004016, partial [Stictis urceolatum]|nr:hypothetical protein [Stictis urceolata]